MPANITPRRAVLTKISYNSQIIDEAIAIYFTAPNSFTGEDVVELHTHGSKAVINMLLDACASLPELQMAEPGEFSKRAFLNNRMDLTAAEGLNDLIEAQTPMQQAQAMRQMQGDMAAQYDNWREMLVTNMALLEAYIDFPDEDLPQELIDQINAGVGELLTTLQGHLDDNKKGEKLREGLTAVILGAPNVGKSSLLNYLAGSEKAIVSDIAGTTRDVVELQLDVAGFPLTFLDTAGIRNSADLIEQEGVKRSLSNAANADIKIVMFAANQAVDEQVQGLVDNDTIVLCNKSDLGSNGNITDAIAVSLKTSSGLRDFEQALQNKIKAKYDFTEAPLITRARHRDMVVNAVHALQEFDLVNKPVELAAEDLRIAAHALGQVTGRIDVEDLLDQIFAKFCIGK